MAAKCLDCGKILFRMSELDENGHSAIDANARDMFENEGEEIYIICPHCKIKNVLINTEGEGGISTLKISHTKK